MAGSSTSLALQDRMSGPLMKIMKAMDQTIKVMERMDASATNMDVRGLSRAKNGLQSASSEMERFLSASRTARVNGLEPLNNQFINMPGPIGKARGAISGFFTSFIGTAAAYLSIQGLINGFKTFAQAADTYSSTSARLANINDGLQTQLELQDKIYAAANRSGSSYTDMANSVAKLNLLAKDAFSGNDETIRFSELMGKAFKVSGASTQEQQAGMYQLTQAMASGKLQGDEFRSIMENAPMLAQAISDSVGVSMGELRKMSSEGQITADIIKNSLFQAAGDIETKFASMPRTFGTSMQLMKNYALQAFTPVLTRFNEFLNSDTFATLANTAMIFIGVMAAGLNQFFDLLAWGYQEASAIGQLISDGWSVIGPVITTAGLALGSYLLMMGALKVALIANAAIEGVRALAVGVSAAATMLANGATLTATATQWGLNAAVLAFPGTWILLAFVAVIALVIYALINWANQTSVVVGFVAGIFAAFGSYVYNMFAQLWNFIAMVAEFLMNVFIDPTYAVQKLMYDMAKSSIDQMATLAGSFDTAADVLAKVFVTAANIAIGGINGLISALKLIPGVEIDGIGKLSVEATTSVLSKGLKSMASNLKAPTSSKNVVNIPRAKLASIPGAFNAGKNLGEKTSLAVSDKLNAGIEKIKGLMKGPSATENPFNPDALGVTDAMKGLGGGDLANGGSGTNPTGGKLDSVGKIDDEINIAEEDIKLMRDLAERQSIQNVITLTPSVTFKDVTIREEADIDQIITKIEKSVEADIARSAEGVYGL